MRISFRPFPAAATVTLAITVGAASPGHAVTVSGSQVSRTVLPGGAAGEVFRVTFDGGLLGGTVTGIRFDNATSGPGTQAQRDAEWTPLQLLTGSNPTASFVSGSLTFTGLNINVPGLGGTVTVVMTGGASLAARDGDVLDLRISDSGAITQSSGTAGGTFPIAPAGSFAIDGMVAAQVKVDSLAAQSFSAGSQGNLALRVGVPANGYQSDVIHRLEVRNLGTAQASSDIERLEVWADNGDTSFQPASDLSLGEMVFTGDRWVLSGLNAAIPAGGRRLFFTADIALFAKDGATVQLAFPGPPDQAIGVTSNNDGLLDRAVADGSTHTIVIRDRITVTSQALASGSARPGQTAVPLYALQAANAYAVTKHLNAITFTNSTTGSGSSSERDAEVASLSIVEDSDDDQVVDGSDTVLGTAFFVGGRATFSGLDWPLKPGESRRLFLVADVSLTGATDGDVLRARIAGPEDLTFSDPTAVISTWPLPGAASRTVDGMVAEQIGNPGAPGVTLAPGDGPVPALQVIVPRNGYADDVLSGLHIVNLGTATNADLAELRLWRDGGDGLFGGDDTDLGALAYAGGVWQSASLAENVGAAGSRLFVSARVAASPTDSATLRLAIPPGGVEVASGDDGPLDAAVANPQTLLISVSRLLATLRISPATSAVGQTVTTTMTLRNVGTEALNAVTPSALSAAGSGTLTPLTGPTPASVSLAPGASQDIAWTYNATAAGDVTLTGSASGVGAVSGLTRTAPSASSNLHRIFARADTLRLSVFQAMPPSVNRGQTGVIPFYLQFSFAPTAAVGSDVRVVGLRVRLESEAGVGIVPSTLATRASVVGAQIYADRTGLEASGSEVDLPFTTPLVVHRGQPITAALSLDIGATTSVPNVRAVIVDASAFTAEDVLTGGPVAVQADPPGYPVRSGVARVLAAATELQADTLAVAPLRIGQGQSDVTLLAMRLQNPGTTGVGADVRVSSLVVGLVDSNGVRVDDPAQYLGRLRLKTAFQTLADVPVVSPAESLVTLVLSPLLSIPAGSPVDVSIVGDVAAGAALGTFRLRLGDASQVDARDASTGASVPVTYLTPPMEGPNATVEATAESLLAHGTGLLPASLPAGSTGVAALRATLRHPGAAGAGRIAVGGLVLRCVDQARNPVVPALPLDRVRVYWDTTLAGNVPDPPASGNTVSVPIAPRLLEPGDTVSVTIVLDFEATAPAGTFELTLGASGIAAIDGNTGKPVAFLAEAGEDLPLLSGLTHILAPARTLEASFDDRMPAILAADGREVPVARVTLRNAAPDGSGLITVDYLRVRAADAQAAPASLGAAALDVRAYRDGTPWGQSAPLSADSLSACITGSSPIQLDVGATATLELRMVTRTNPGVSALRIGMMATDVGVVQPSQPLLAVSVLPAPGQSLPWWSEIGTFQSLALKDSYFNFPNPFAAGREGTAFAFYLPAPGRVSLRIFTARGEPVRTVFDGEARASGLHQDDVWDGRNGRGAVVTNGVYVAELTVRLDDGSQQRLLRRVAVLR
jgi:hypothetical protein